MDPRSDDPLAAQSGFERFLLDQVEAAVVAADPAGRITFWNRFAEELLGYMAEEALGRDVIELIVDRDDREAVLGILQCLGAGERWQGELDVVTKDGRTLPVRMRASPAHDAAGGFEGMASVLVDISEIRRGERRRSAQHAVTRVLADSESLAEAAPGILEAVGAGLGWEMGALWVIDPHAGRLQCVDTWTAPDAKLDEFVGLTRRTAFGRGTGLPGRVWSTGEPTWVPDVVVDENFPRAPSAAQHELHGAVAFPIVLGREVLGVLEFFSREIREPDQDLLATMTSIGSQLGQFLERRVAEEEARRSAARKSAMLESALDCIVSIDAAQRVVDFNPAAERTFGYTREEAVGRDVAELIVPEYLRERHRAAFARHLETGRAAILGRRMELTGVNKEGREFPIELTVARIEGDREPMFTAFIRDISERKRIEEERLVLLAAEEEALKRAERVREQMEFLAEANAVLTSSLDYGKTMNKVVKLAVPALADWCSVEVLDDDDIRPVAVAHADPDLVEATWDLRRRWPSRTRSPIGAPEVIRTGKSRLFEQVTDDMLRQAARDPDHLKLMQSLGVSSAMVVPLRARGRTFGAITFVSTDAARSYGPEDLALAEALGERAAQAADNARLYQERARVARALQQSLLPQRLPDIDWLEVAARYRAAGEGEVGGDFYDVFEARDGAWFAVIGDVQGKGPEAAAVTGLARHTIRAAAASEPSPAAVLRALNEAIVNEWTERFATVALARVELRNGKAALAVSCGGHPLPFILRASGAVEHTDCKGNLLGLFSQVELRNYVAELGPGDALVLYTDGVTEEHSGTRVFGEDRLTALLGELAGQDADGIAGRVEQAVLDFGEPEPRDDMAVLVLRVRDLVAHGPEHV